MTENVDKGNFSWMTPTDKLYAVTYPAENPNDLEARLLAVLCMTENRPKPDGHEVSPYAIPNGRRLGFLISQERFLNKFLLPGMPLLFSEKISSDGSTNKDITTDDFSIKNLTITNNVALKFNKQKLKNGKVVQPIIDPGNFNILLESNNLQYRLTNLHFEYSEGITVKIDHTAYANLSITPERKFSLKVNNSTTSASVSTSKKELIKATVASITASVILAAVGGMAGEAASVGGTMAIDGAEASIDAIEVTAEESIENEISNLTSEAIEEAGDEAAESVSEEGGSGTSKIGEFKNYFAKNWAKILGRVIGGTIGAATGTIPLIIKDIANHNAKTPTIDKLGTEALSPFTWPELNNDGFIIHGGGINGCLQIGFDIDLDKI